MNSDELRELKNQLLEDKKRVEQLLESYEADEPFLASQEINTYDQQHHGDFGTELDERQKDIALHEHTEEEYREIERALRKMDEGTYGICERTGKPIPIERLRAMPTARYIIDEETK